MEMLCRGNLCDFRSCALSVFLDLVIKQKMEKNQFSFVCVLELDDAPFLFLSC